jgi:hypothetical protein
MRTRCPNGETQKSRRVRSELLFSDAIVGAVEGCRSVCVCGCECCEDVEWGWCVDVGEQLSIYRGARAGRREGGWARWGRACSGMVWLYVLTPDRESTARSNRTGGAYRSGNSGVGVSVWHGRTFVCVRRTSTRVRMEDRARLSGVEDRGWSGVELICVLTYAIQRFSSKQTAQDSMCIWSCSRMVMRW